MSHNGIILEIQFIYRIRVDTLFRIAYNNCFY